MKTTLNSFTGQIKSRLVEHVKATTAELVEMLTGDVKSHMQQGDFKEAASMLQDIVQHQEDAQQLISMIESTKNIGALIHNIQYNVDWFGVYFMEDTMELMSVMFDVEFQIND